MSQRGTGTELSSPIRLAIGTTPSDQKPELQNALQPIYTSLNTLVAALRTYAGAGSWANKPVNPLVTHSDGNSCRIYVVAGEAGMMRGSIISLLDNGNGYCQAVLASATSALGRKPCGVINTNTESTELGDVIEVMLFDGATSAIENLTPGARYYVSTTNGVITSTPPSGAGIVAYLVGIALSSKCLLLRMDL